LSRINWLAVQTYRWLEPCQPLVQIDWHRSASSHGIRLHWLIATERQTLLERLLLDRKLSFKRRLLEPSVVQYEFHDQLPQTVFVLGDHFTGNDQELPVNL